MSGGQPVDNFPAVDNSGTPSRACHHERAAGAVGRIKCSDADSRQEVAATLLLPPDVEPEEEEDDGDEEVEEDDELEEEDDEPDEPDESEVDDELDDELSDFGAVSDFAGSEDDFESLRESLR